MEIVKFGNTGLSVKVEKGVDGKEDVWLNGENIATLFERDYKTIQKHINSIYKNGEVGDNTFKRNQVITEKNGKKYKTYKSEYNLDVILMVGYKVNGKRGVEFRKWANQVLGKYLKQGYVVNDKVMLEKGMGEVLGLLNTMQRDLIQGKRAGSDDINEVLEIIKDYGYSFTTLQKYDEGRLTLEGSEKHTKYILNYDSAIRYIQKLKEELIKRGEATILFGQERNDNPLDRILGAVFNFLFGEESYPSLEEKASHILYFIVKDHPFNDGNKRIASFLFSLFLQKNNFHLKSSGEKKINDNTLAALVIMIAESNPKEKDQYIKLLVNALRAR